MAILLYNIAILLYNMCILLYNMSILLYNMPILVYIPVYTPRYPYISLYIRRVMSAGPFEGFSGFYAWSMEVVDG